MTTPITEGAWRVVRHADGTTTETLTCPGCAHRERALRDEREELDHAIALLGDNHPHIGARVLAMLREQIALKRTVLRLIDEVDEANRRTRQAVEIALDLHGRLKATTEA